MLPQNKIAGMSIAWGRGKWAELEDGSFGYIFPEDDAFKIRINPEQMEDLEISEDDLYDCIAQIEAEFGAPKDHRLAFGLFPNQGYSHLGITVRSSINSRVVCVFTPTSIEDNSYDGYFEWYYDKGAIDYGNVGAYLTAFDKVTGNRGGNVVMSPVMPTYSEAAEKTGHLKSSVREDFLRQVWNFHRTGSRGFRMRLEAELLPRWKKICEEHEAEETAQAYKRDLKTLPPSDLRSVFGDLAQKVQEFDEFPPESPEAQWDEKKTRDQFKMVKDEVYTRALAGETV